MTDGDILITCSIMSIWDGDENVYDKVLKQLAMKTLYRYGGCSQGNSLGHQFNHMGFTKRKMQQIKYLQYV
jgi:hypothetical protein